MPDQSELDRIADELYVLHPDAFAAARDERVKQARAAGQKELARDLAALRRPTLSAWVVNLLWRDQGAVVEQLIELAEAMSHAQAQGSGAALRELMGQRREAEAALLRRASALAEGAGVKVTPAMAREVQDSLAAAMARPDVAAEVRSGRLVKPATYAGFGDLAMSLPTPSVAKPAARPAQRTSSGRDTSDSPTAPAPISKPSPPKPDELAERRAAAERAEAEQRAQAVRRAQAEERVAAARGALELAAALLAEETRAAEFAETRHQELRAQLRALEQQATAAEAIAKAAAERRAAAQKAHDAARDAVEQAEKSVPG
jgi:hypothetical protein